MNDSIVRDLPEVPDKAHAEEAPGLKEFFAPQSVAVIGASPKEGNQGRRIMKSIQAHGFTGRVVAVHPRGEAIPPYPAVKSVADLAQGTDLAIAVVPARNVPGLVEPLARKGVRHLIVISAGFAETGLEEGQRLDESLKAAGKRYGVRIIGPNCMGVLSAPERFNSFFLSPDEFSFPPSGPVALISQSGALMSLVLDRLAGLKLGVHRAVSIGNRADVGECELLEAFANDPSVGVIGLYLEGVQDGPRFVETARKVAREKPVVIWKGGHGSRGGEAARAHSASLAGSYEVFQAACEKAGLIEVSGFEEFVQALEVFSLQAPVMGRRILIASNGGGIGVFLTDLCESFGLEAPEPPKTAQEELRSTLPGYYSFRNPVDLTSSGTNEQCVLAIETLLETGCYDGLLLFPLPGTAGITPEIASLIHGHVPKHLPVVAGTYGLTMDPQMSEEFHKHGIPCFTTAEAAVQAMRLLVRRGEDRMKTKLPGPAGKPSYHFESIDGWSKWLKEMPDEMEIKNFLRLCGVEVPRSLKIMHRQDLENATLKWGFPIALKAVGKGLRHKTEIGGVHLDIETMKELIEAWQKMSSTWPGAVWAEEQMPPGEDLMVGAHRDPQFGPVLVFGSGGQYVEIFRDIQRVLLPATNEELFRMIYKTRAGEIIAGARGLASLDGKHLFEFLKLVAGWILSEDGIETMDFNPVRLYDKGLVVLDAKIIPTQNL